MNFNNLFDNLGEILKQSSNLYSFSALITVVIAVVCIIFYARSLDKYKNRAFYLSLFCFMGLALATLTAGIWGGFQQGNEIGIEQGVEEVQEQIQQDPSVVSISDNAAKTLNDLITSNGEEITSDSKSLMVEKSLEAFDNSLEAKSIDQPSWIEKKEGFTFNFQGCSRRTGSTDVRCDLLITNEEDNDRYLKMYATVNNNKSIIVDSKGEEYNTRDAALGNEPDYAGWYAGNTLPSSVEVGAWVLFEGVSTEVDKLQIVKFEFESGNSNDFDIRHQNIEITSTDG